MLITSDRILEVFLEYYIKKSNPKRTSEIQI